jgi:hypothetical protein
MSVTIDLEAHPGSSMALIAGGKPASRSKNAASSPCTGME